MKSITFKKLIYPSCIVAIVFTVLLASVLSVGFYHPDEHFQILEFLLTKMDSGQKPFLAWEFRAEIRPWIQILFYKLVLAVPQLFGVDDRFTYAFILRMTSGVLSLCALFLVASSTVSMVTGRRTRQFMICLGGLSFYFAYLGVRTSSETFSAALLVFGMFFSLLMSGRYAVLGGFFLGLCFSARYQLAFSIFGFLLWTLLFGKFTRIQYLKLVTGFIFSVFLAQFANWWGYGHFTFPEWRYLVVNIFEGKANEFGVLPWNGYWTLFHAFIPRPFSYLMFFVCGAFFLFFRKHVFTFTMLPFIIVHFILAHKEERFLFPLFLFVAPMTVMVFDRIYFKIRKAIFLRRVLISAASVSFIWNLIVAGWLISNPRFGNFAFLEWLNRKSSPTAVIWYEANPFFILNSLPLNFYFPKNGFTERRVGNADQLDALGTRKSVIFWEHEMCASHLNLVNCKYAGASPQLAELFADGVLKRSICRYFRHQKLYRWYECN